MTLDSGGWLAQRRLHEGLLELSVGTQELEARGGWHSRERGWLGGRDTPVHAAAQDQRDLMSKQLLYVWVRSSNHGR